MDEFGYLIHKIENAKFVRVPFPHLLIENMLSPEHLGLFLNSSQVHFEHCKNTPTLLKSLHDHGFVFQPFPGCYSNEKQYLEWVNGKRHTYKEPIEGKGVAFRLREIKNVRIQKVLDFLNSDRFHKCLKRKFRISPKRKTSIITAVQKYLTGYEISPHPDVRRKALTYLLNINKGDFVEKEDVHTHLLRFKKDKKWVERYWNGTKTERCWVPWNWCETVNKIRSNNSMIIFAPSYNTLHAVKLDYNHLKYQRTQIYGNLMYIEKPLPMAYYKDLPFPDVENEKKSA